MCDSCVCMRNSAEIKQHSFLVLRKKHKAEGGTETFRQEVRGGFGPESYLKPSMRPVCLACTVPKSDLLYILEKSLIEADHNHDLYFGLDSVRRYMDSVLCQVQCLEC